MTAKLFCTGCGHDRRGHGKLVCLTCWGLLGKALQRRVYSAWNDGDPTDDYSAACDAAFDRIRERTGAQRQTITSEISIRRIGK